MASKKLENKFYIYKPNLYKLRERYLIYIELEKNDITIMQETRCSNLHVQIWDTSDR